jgi:hypothetical protein
MSVPTPTHPSHTSPSDSAARGRLWIGGAVAATVLVLGTSGTLSSWTAAVLQNDTNTAVTADAVILSESDGTATCASSDAPTTNSFICTTINKYGGTTTPLAPGGSRVVDVTFTNTGAADASSFALAPGACSQTPTAGSGTPAAANVCTSGDLTVAVSCSPGAEYDGDFAWSDLVYTAGAPPTATATHTATGGDLDADATWTCRFTVAVVSGASVLAQGVAVSQPLTWTLTD